MLHSHSLNLNSIFGDQVPSRATVFNWFAEFRKGRTSLSDEERLGRPATAVTPDNLANGRYFVLESGHIATITLLEQKTVTARWYIDVYIPQVLQKWMTFHPRSKTSNLFWHHDNASSHKAISTLDFNDDVITVMSHHFLMIVVSHVRYINIHILLNFILPSPKMMSYSQKLKFLIIQR